MTETGDCHGVVSAAIVKSEAAGRKAGDVMTVPRPRPG